MSYDIYYTIRENHKSYYVCDTLFFGKQKRYDYKNIKKGLIFDSYVDCLNYIYSHNLYDVHIRRTISCTGYTDFTDYKYRFPKVDKVGK